MSVDVNISNRRFSRRHRHGLIRPQFVGSSGSRESLSNKAFFCQCHIPFHESLVSEEEHTCTCPRSIRTLKWAKPSQAEDRVGLDEAVELEATSLCAMKSRHRGCWNSFSDRTAEASCKSQVQYVDTCGLNHGQSISRRSNRRDHCRWKTLKMCGIGNATVIDLLC